MKWNISFCDKEQFPHPNISIQYDHEYSPTILDDFPEIRDIISKWASDNIDVFSCERLAQFVQNE